MSNQKLIVLSVLVAVLGAAQTAWAAPATPNAEKRCVFQEYAPVSVAPFHQDEDYGLGTYTRLGGAQVYVQARPGLTAEWLTLSVQRELAKLTAADGCRPSVRGVHVSTISAGGGFWVVMTAQNERDAKALLNWARDIVPRSR